MAIIAVNNLQKKFDEQEAILGISFEIQEGELYGLVGPDGAGKTSTMRVICGLLKEFEGSVSVFGKNVKTDRRAIQEKIGYLPQRFSLYGDLSVDENIAFFAEIHNVRDYESRRKELLEMTRMTPFGDRPAGKLSGGMKQKLALSCSLIHKPQLLILDEPTTGVDPISRRDFWKILSELNRDGLTVFMATPYLDEAERCHRIALMHHGKLLAMNTPSEIKQAMHKKTLEIICTPVRGAFLLVQNKTKNEVQLFGDRIHIVAESPDEVFAEISALFQTAGITIKEHRIKPLTLENIFIAAVKESY